ncbi:MAG TPA: hypothetical protein VIK91_09670 [Nannocystis sp.]
MRTIHATTLLLALSAGALSACGEGRQAMLERELAYQKAGRTDDKGNPIPEIPPDETREALRPLLTKIYSNTERLPDVQEGDVEPTNGRGYVLQPGVLAVVTTKKGLSKADKARAVILGVAEADAWTFRKNARKEFALLVEKLKYSYGEDTKTKVLDSYADLKLLSFFGSPEAEQAIGELSGDVKGVAEAMRKEYVEGREEIWKKWMGVKMYARRLVGQDEPFRSVLKKIAKDLGQEEVPPRPFKDSVDAPFKAWAAAIEADEKLLTLLTNYRELRERVDFLGEAHTLWAIEGSDLVPERARGVVIDKKIGYGFYREDLGGGYNDLVFVFSKKLAGSELKRAFLHSFLFRQLLTDFQMLSTAGSDFAKRGIDGQIDMGTSIVPDKYDPLYASCGATAALDTMLVSYGSEYELLRGVPAKVKDSEAALKVAHKCVIEGAKGDIKIPAKDDEFDTEGPAPASRLALFQMLARFENIKVNTAVLAGDKRTEEDDAIDEAEKLLKQLKAEKAAQNQ